MRVSLMELTAIDRVRHHQKLFRPFFFGVLATLTAQLRIRDDMYSY
jgi:hypothetical protein